MKRLLQIVALVLVVGLTAEPLVAAMGCGESACGHRVMACCRHNHGMAAMTMGDCPDDAAMMAARQCPGGCCAAMARPVAPPAAAATAVDGRMMVAAPVAWREDLRHPVATPPPARRIASQRARYLLFRDLRI